MTKHKWISIPLSDLVPADWNYKNKNSLHTKQQIAHLEKSLKRHGQVQGLLVRSLSNGKFEVVNGNHRLEVMKSLGFEEATCVNLGKIPLPQAKKIALSTNEISIKADEYLLGQMFTEFDQPFDELEAELPFMQNEIEEFAALQSYDFDDDAADEIEDNAEEDEKAEPTQKTIMAKVDLKTFALWEAWTKKLEEKFGIEGKALAFKCAISIALKRSAKEISEAAKDNPPD